MQKGVFKPSFFGFVWFWLLFFGFLCFWGREARTAIFLQFQSFFIFHLLVPPKTLASKSFFPSCLSSSFSFVFPCKTISAFSFFVISPFGENNFVFFAVSFFVPHSFLMLASFLQTKFPDMPFSNPSCFHVWLGSSVVVLFFLFYLCSCYVFYVFIVFVHLVVSVVLLSDYEKHSRNSSMVWCIVGSNVIYQFCFCSSLSLCCFASLCSMKLECSMCVLSFFFTTQD